MYIHEDAFTSGKEPDKYKTGNIQVLIHLLHSFNIKYLKKLFLSSVFMTRIVDYESEIIHFK